MTVQKEVVKLLMTKQEAWEFSLNPPPEMLGISTKWCEWLPLKEGETEKDQKVIAEFITSDRFLVRNERKTEKDIRFLLGTTFRNRLLDKGLTHPNATGVDLRIFAPLKHPIFSDPDTPSDMKRAAETARDVKKVLFSREDLENSHHPEIQPQHVGQNTRQMMKKFNIEYEYGVREKTFQHVPEKGYVEVEGPEKIAIEYGEIESG